MPTQQNTSEENRSRFSAFFSALRRKSSGYEIDKSYASQVKTQATQVQEPLQKKWVADPHIEDSKSPKETVKPVLHAIEDAEQSAELKQKLSLQAELLMHQGIYRGLYQSLKSLDNSYKKVSPSGTRQDEVDFITSVLNSLLDPSSIHTELDEKMQMMESLNKAQNSYQVLVGACIYIHQRIKDDYKDSWSAMLWSKPESSSGLLKILTGHLNAIDIVTQRVSINQLKVHVQMQAGELEQKHQIDYPKDKNSGKAESLEAFITNTLSLLEAFCPDANAPSANVI